MSLDPVSAILDIGSKVIDRLWPDPSKAAEAKLELFKMQQNGELAQLAAETELAKGQLEINKVEAASSSLLVSGGRPFIIWVCGFSLLYAAILEPMARFTATVLLHYVGPFPVLDTTITLQVLFALLGLSGYRSIEKVKGVASK
jgi:hypothetical protein